MQKRTCDTNDAYSKEELEELDKKQKKPPRWFLRGIEVYVFCPPSLVSIFVPPLCNDFFFFLWCISERAHTHCTPDRGIEDTQLGAGEERRVVPLRRGMLWLVVVWKVSGRPAALL